jgi:hypothetical protein
VHLRHAGSYPAKRRQRLRPERAGTVNDCGTATDQPSRHEIARQRRELPISNRQDQEIRFDGTSG